MRFYRLEMKDTKQGVYRSDSTEVDEIIECFTSMDRHPTPWNDSLLGDKLWERKWSEFGTNEGMEQYIFGFKSLKQFRAWFYSDVVLLELEEKDIELNLYQTTDYITGYTQMIARKDELKFVKTLPILGK